MKSTRPYMPECERTFASIPRCSSHPGELLTMDGACPRCEREAFQTRVLTQEEAKEARKLQALARAQRPTEGDKRRRMTGAEAERIAGTA